MTDPVGPLFAGGFQHIKAGAYELLYLPDLHNDLLQREGKAFAGHAADEPNTPADFGRVLAIAARNNH